MIDDRERVGTALAARIIGVQTQTLRNWRANQRDDRPQAIKVGHAVLYDRDEVEEFAQTYSKTR